MRRKDGNIRVTRRLVHAVAVASRARKSERAWRQERQHLGSRRKKSASSAMEPRLQPARSRDAFRRMRTGEIHQSLDGIQQYAFRPKSVVTQKAEEAHLGAPSTPATSQPYSRTSSTGQVAGSKRKQRCRPQGCCRATPTSIRRRRSAPEASRPRSCRNLGNLFRGMPSKLRPPTVRMSRRVTPFSTQNEIMSSRGPYFITDHREARHGVDEAANFLFLKRFHVVALCSATIAIRLHLMVTVGR